MKRIRMVEMMNYSAGLTSKLFWLQESRKTASYIAEGYDKTQIKKIAWSENIYQVKAEYRAYEVLNGTYRRVSLLPEAVLKEFVTCDIEITDRDLNNFFSDKSMQSDVIAGWTESAVKKLKQCMTRMMFEAGILESSGKPRIIRPIHVNYHTEELLKANGLEDYLRIVEGV